jgi:hypothetical protein
MGLSIHHIYLSRMLSGVAGPTPSMPALISS